MNMTSEVVKCTCILVCTVPSDSYVKTCIASKECDKLTVSRNGVPRNFVWGGGGVQQIQLRTEDRQNGDLGAVAP